MNKITICIFLFLTSCSYNKKKEGDMYISVVSQISLKSKKDLNTYRAIMIVPSEGCGGCISGAENFMINDFISTGRKGILFVVTGLESKKSAVARLGQIAVNNADVYIDYLHSFDKPPFMTEYPKVLFLDKGEWKKTEIISPETSEKTYNDIVATLNN